MRVKSTKAHTSITLSPRPNAGIRKKQFLVVEEGRYGSSGLRRKRVEESYTSVDTVTRKQTMADCRWWCTPSLLLVCLALLARTSSAQGKWRSFRLAVAGGKLLLLFSRS